MRLWALGLLSLGLRGFSVSTFSHLGLRHSKFQESGFGACRCRVQSSDLQTLGLKVSG